MRTTLLLSLAFVTLFFTSCSKSGGSDAQKIIGTWNHSIAVAEGMKMTMTFTFNANDTMEIIMFGQALGELSYELRDGTLHTVTVDGDLDSMPYSFSGDSLILIMDDTEEGRTAWIKGEVPVAAPMMEIDTTEQPLETTMAGTPIEDSPLPAQGTETMKFLGIKTYGGDSEMYTFKLPNGTITTFSVQFNRAVEGAATFTQGSAEPNEDDIYGNHIGERVVVSWTTEDETNMGGETHSIIALQSMKLAQ